MALLDGNKLSGSDGTFFSFDNDISVLTSFDIEEADAHIREVIHEAFLKTEEEYLRISEELGEFRYTALHVTFCC